MESGAFRPSDQIWGGCGLLVRTFGVKLVVGFYFFSGPTYVRHGVLFNPVVDESLWCGTSP